MNDIAPNPDKQLADLRRILEITRAISAEVNLDNLLAKIVTATTELLDAERSSLWIVNRTQRRIFTRIAQGEGIGTLHAPIGRGIAGTVAENGETINIPDAYADARFDPAFDKKTGFVTRSILCMALRNHDGQIVGVAQVLNKKDGPFTPYDEFLLQTLAGQTGVVLEQMRLKEIEFAQRKLHAELQLARDIQRRLLPNGAPDFETLSVAGFNRPADETGGDYYDFVPTAGDKLGLLIGDVSGHGLPSALVMTAARAMMRSMALSGMTPDAVLERANDLLCEDLDDSRFMTMLFAVIDPESREIAYASAGHEPPLIYRPSTDTFIYYDVTGTPLGMFEAMQYDIDGPYPLQSGDTVTLFTDGVFEAMNADDEEFGMKRMENVIRAGTAAGDDADALIRRLIDAVDAFVGNQPQKDDITCVVVNVF